MNETTLVLLLGLVAGVGMLAWAVFGAVTGRIYTEGSGGNDDDRRTYARLVCRNREPARFWLTCITYGTVGVAVLAVVTLMLFR